MVGVNGMAASRSLCCKRDSTIFRGTAFAMNRVREAPMTEIRRILCPLDFSESSRHALENALMIATWYKARIAALHVLRPDWVPEPIGLADFPAPVVNPEHQRQVAETCLREWLTPAAQAGIPTETLLEEGRPASCILQQATSQDTDLIVMGTHGLSGFDRLLLGSVAETVLRKAGCPVMTVPPAAQVAARVPYRRLLCPIDFSDSSLAAFQFAVSLAEEADAHLTILHVLEWPPNTEHFLGEFDTSEYRLSVERDVRARLDALVTAEMRVFCRPSSRIAHGKAYRAILNVADHEAADLIVMGVLGRNPVDLALFGSTTNHVVRQANCPVLTLKQ